MAEVKGVDPARVKALAKAGMTAQEVADALDIDRSTAYYHAAQQGVRFRRAKHGAARKIPSDLARKMRHYREMTGFSWELVGAKFGVKGYAARRAVLRYEEER